MAKYTVDEVIRSLSQKKDVKVNPVKKEVNIMSVETKKTNDLGNGSWGKIDFLTNHAGYTKYFVTEW